MIGPVLWLYECNISDCQKMNSRKKFVYELVYFKTCRTIQIWSDTVYEFELFSHRLSWLICLAKWHISVRTIYYWPYKFTDIWHFITSSLKIRAHLTHNMFKISELLCHIFQVTHVLLTSLITALQLGWEWHCWYSSSSCWWSTWWAAKRGLMATSLCERCCTPKSVRPRSFSGVKENKACTAIFDYLMFLYLLLWTVWRLEHSLYSLNTLLNVQSSYKWFNESWIVMLKVNNSKIFKLWLHKETELVIW